MAGQRATQALKRLAVRQDAVFHRRQLRAIGFSDDEIDHRIASGHLYSLLRGVLSLTPTPTERGWHVVALLAGGRQAGLSRRSAARVLGLIPQCAVLPLHITAPTKRRSSPPRFFAHRGDVELVTRRDGLRITTPIQTLVDLARTETVRTTQRALDQAHIKRMLDIEALVAIKRKPKILQAAIDRHLVGLTITRSELEEAFLSFVHDSGFPQPHVNHKLLGFTADFLWQAQRFVAETDGLKVHTLPDAFARDRRRDRVHRRAGYRVERFTWWDVTDEQRELYEELAPALLG